MTIQTRVAAARLRLRDAGVSAAESDLDARLLAQHLLGWTTEQFLVRAGQDEPGTFAAEYDGLVARRAAREPVAYIVGHREFWGLEFEVTPDVLIPRPSTELIVEAALDLFPDRHAPLALADICTGCGCVAVSVAHARPDATVVATDISTAALVVAARNARRNDVDTRILFRRADLLDGIDRRFDAVFANPPYVVDRAAPALQPEVRDFEPAVALFGGVDGLTIIGRLVEQAPARLKPGAFLIFEFGYGQDVEVETLVGQAAELKLVDVRRDIQGIARTAICRRL